MNLRHHSLREVRISEITLISMVGKKQLLAFGHSLLVKKDFEYLGFALYSVSGLSKKFLKANSYLVQIPMRVYHRIGKTNR